MNDSILMNMFSMFDPNLNNIPINLYLMLLMMLTMPNKIWINSCMLNKTKIKMKKFMINNNINNKTMVLLMLTLTEMMFSMNMMNLIPNFLSPSNNMMFNLSMTMILWMTMFTTLMKNNKILFMNLSPKNTPLLLMWIINLIELNSMMFQILSLTMRLTINMMMGHIIINLIDKIMIIYIYLLIEFMIILIQTYIFSILNLLNFSNVN